MSASLKTGGSSPGSKPGSAQSEAERMKSASAIVASLSRPSSQKSGAWSKEDPEAGRIAKEQEVEEAKKLALKKRKKKDEMDAILEEAMEEEKAVKGQQPVGCWSKFIETLSNIWSTTDLLNGEETEERVRTTTRELVIYLVFMAILCWVTLTAMNPVMFRYTATLKDLFKKQEEVGQVSDFWEFLETDLLDGLYWESWYNNGDDPDHLPCAVDRVGIQGPCPIPLKERMIMYSNRLLGAPRLRMLRVMNESCLIPEEFKDAIKVCYDSYSPTIEDKESFFPGYRKYTTADAWRYQSVQELEGHDYSGLLATYSGAGSVQPLRELRNVTRLIIREMKEGLWIKRGTRYVSLDFTLYNANINLFCVIKLNFEFSPTGGIIPSGDYSTVKLLRYITETDYALMGAEFVFTAMLLYYIVEEAMEIKANKLAYFLSFWNCLDIFVILISAATVTFNIYKYIEVNTLLKGLLAQPEVYADFSYLAFWSHTFTNAAGIAVFMAWIKVFKFISFNKTMSQLSGTITRSLPDLGAFGVMFMIVFLSYAQVAYLVFGPFVKEFSTLKATCFTQFRLILGDFDFTAIESAHAVWGPVYFITYVFFVFFVLMNMFMAILNDTYSEVKEEIENRKEDFQMLDFLKRGYNNVLEMIAERDKLIDIQTTVKLAADDGVVTFDEIRENLRKLNFSDAEIEIFCAKYDRDGNFEFTVDELNDIEKGIDREMEELHRLELNRKYGVAISRPNSTRKMEKEEEEAPPPPPTQGALMQVQNRVDKMESMMGVIAQKVSTVLIKLDMIEDNNRKISAKVREITSASGGDAEKHQQIQELVDEQYAEE